MNPTGYDAARRIFFRDVKKLSTRERGMRRNRD